MNDGTPQAPCPRCGSSAQVLTVQEMFDLLNGVQDDSVQQAEQIRMFGPPPGQRRDVFGPGNDPYASPSQEIANAVFGAAGKLLGRGTGHRRRRGYGERIGLALDATLARARVAQEQARSEQAAIVARYPDLRGCLADEVVFLAGGTQVVPIADIPMPVTLASADVLVSRLRTP